MISSHVFPLQVRVDLRVMIRKRYSTFSKVSGLEPLCQIQFSVISSSLVASGVDKLILKIDLVSHLARVYIYIYIYKSNIYQHSRYQKKKKKKPQGTRDNKQYLESPPGGKRKNYRSKRKKRPTSSDPLKKSRDTLSVGQKKTKTFCESCISIHIY